MQSLAWCVAIFQCSPTSRYGATAGDNGRVLLASVRDRNVVTVASTILLVPS